MTRIRSAISHYPTIEVVVIALGSAGMIGASVVGDDHPFAFALSILVLPGLVVSLALSLPLLTRRAVPPALVLGLGVAVLLGYDVAIRRDPDEYFLVLLLPLGTALATSGIATLARSWARLPSSPPARPADPDETGECGGGT